jgi:hypothetical protein
VQKRPRIEVWPEPLALGAELPPMPLWLALDLCVPLVLEANYTATCRSLRIPARSSTRANRPASSSR